MKKQKESTERKKNKPFDKADLLHLPISKIIWVHRDDLDPNDYNPNAMIAENLELLSISILEDGWTQPIVVYKDGNKYIIIDGFHRYKASGIPIVYEKTGGYVPVCVQPAKDRESNQISTIRHNRAKGVHGVVPMASMLKEMIQNKTDIDTIMFRLKMSREEVLRLAQSQGIPEIDIISGGEFSKAWVPQ